MGLPPQAQQQLLLNLLESARKHATEMNQRAAQVTVDIAKEKTQYFEKIALASGGTIALVVSFVGSHAGRLQPPWLLRSALIVLVLAMVGAMYRNWRYPFYIMGIYGRQYMEARRDKGRRERDYVTTFPSLGREEDGTPIDITTFQTQFSKDESIFKSKIEECEKQEQVFFCNCQVRRVSDTHSGGRGNGLAGRAGLEKFLAKPEYFSARITFSSIRRP